MNKRGLSLVVLFEFILIVMAIAILIGTYLLLFNYTNEAFDQDVNVGQVNLAGINNQTFGKLNEAFGDTADIIGLALIFGMVISMFANAYFFGNKYPKLMWVIDFILLIFAFMLSVTVSRSYSILINSSPLLDVFINDLPKTSTFILTLPLIVSTVGVIMMILTYAGLNRDRRGVNVLGY